MLRNTAPGFASVFVPSISGTNIGDAITAIKSSPASDCKPVFLLLHMYDQLYLQPLYFLSEFRMKPSSVHACMLALLTLNVYIRATSYYMSFLEPGLKAANYSNYHPKGPEVVVVVVVAHTLPGGC